MREGSVINLKKANDFYSWLLKENIGTLTSIPRDPELGHITDADIQAFTSELSDSQQRDEFYQIYDKWFEGLTQYNEEIKIQRCAKAQAMGGGGGATLMGNIPSLSSFFSQTKDIYPSDWQEYPELKTDSAYLQKLREEWLTLRPMVNKIQEIDNEMKTVTVFSDKKPEPGLELGPEKIDKNLQKLSEQDKEIYARLIQTKHDDDLDLLEFDENGNVVSLPEDSVSSMVDNIESINRVLGELREKLSEKKNTVKLDYEKTMIETQYNDKIRSVIKSYKLDQKLQSYIGAIISAQFMGKKEVDNVVALLLRQIKDRYTDITNVDVLAELTALQRIKKTTLLERLQQNMKKPGLEEFMTSTTVDTSLRINQEDFGYQVKIAGQQLLNKLKHAITAYGPSLRETFSKRAFTAKNILTGKGKELLTSAQYTKSSQNILPYSARAAGGTLGLFLAATGIKMGAFCSFPVHLMSQVLFAMEQLKSQNIFENIAGQPSYPISLPVDLSFLSEYSIGLCEYGETISIVADEVYLFVQICMIAILLPDLLSKLFPGLKSGIVSQIISLFQIGIVLGCLGISLNGLTQRTYLQGPVWDPYYDQPHICPGPSYSYTTGFSSGTNECLSWWGQAVYFKMLQLLSIGANNGILLPIYFLKETMSSSKYATLFIQSEFSLLLATSAHTLHTDYIELMREKERLYSEAETAIKELLFGQSDITLSTQEFIDSFKNSEDDNLQKLGESLQSLLNTTLSEISTQLQITEATAQATMAVIATKQQRQQEQQQEQQQQQEPLMMKRAVVSPPSSQNSSGSV